MALHGMWDIETMGTGPDAIILSIGGIKFDPNGEKMIDGFHYRFNVNDQEAKGRTTDESTLEWWGKQDNKVIEVAFGDEGRTDVTEILRHMSRWYVGVNKIWAQGVVFDMGILENIYKQYGIPHPWKFWDVRDSRTLFGIMPTDPRKAMKFDAHDALEDAKAQALCVQQTIKKLGLTLK